jgi:hypothetical protein
MMTAGEDDDEHEDQRLGACAAARSPQPAVADVCDAGTTSLF